MYIYKIIVFDNLGLKMLCFGSVVELIIVEWLKRCIWVLYLCFDILFLGYIYFDGFYVKRSWCGSCEV